jgi:diguanylate cyclase (GGDEF)-like protein
VLAATTDAWEFPEDAESRLGLFAELASLAIANAQARQDLALRATVDDLTEALNQGEFHRRMDTECGRALRHARPLSLVVFDLDHFKRVNDGLGHPVGDRVLRATARAISAELRGEDILARVGGEEFALILPETGLADAAEAAERVRLAVARIHRPGLPPVTISAGVAELSDAPSPERLFAAADQALYAAKRAGRNRVCRFDPSAAAPDMYSAPSQTPVNGMAAIRALALAVEAKDAATREHSERVADLAGRLAAAAGWASHRIDALRESALVHDVGKIGVPDRLLLKRGPLSPSEYDRVKIHPSLGAGIVAEVLDPEQASWVRHHHERYDGGGYPSGLVGTQIPDGARLLAVADAFDVMTTGRRYARARSRDDALGEIRSLAGAQFCPDAVAALERALDA